MIENGGCSRFGCFVFLMIQYYFCIPCCRIIGVPLLLHCLHVGSIPYQYTYERTTKPPATSLGYMETFVRTFVGLPPVLIHRVILGLPACF
ncbi:hypothetical protein GDO78_019601 [Eleutherodactylus coqui]|uniref:Uncharacterized protein n=1 Tax=Eleutherodactylus coqui TaxID=57060 RepID=A0A8J6JY36_ELECQ|nr:hypothetical protein GDO78_019601 [Eleutherodactylus coqui]